MENFRDKTPEELDNQLGKAESLLGGRIKPENFRQELLSMSLEEIKTRYPREYKSYFSALKVEASGLTPVFKTLSLNVFERFGIV